MAASLSLEDMLATVLAPRGGGFRAPTPVVPAEAPRPRMRPSIFQAGPLAAGTAEPEVPIPGRPSAGAVIPEEPATRPSPLGKAGDYFAAVSGGVEAGSQIDNPLGAFLAGIGGAISADRSRKAELAKLGIEADDRKYQRGRDEASDRRAEEEFGLKKEEYGLTKRKTEAEIAKEERAAKNPLTPQVLLDIEERAAAFAKEQGLYDTSSIMSAEERAAALERVRQYRQALRDEISTTGQLPAENAPGEIVKDQGQLAPPTEAPAVGTIEDGYRFLGGDPSLPESWERVQ